MSRFSGLPTRAKIVLFLVVLAAGVLAVRLARGGVVWQWEADPMCAINEPLVEDLWFDGQGQLITVQRNGSVVSVNKWNLSCQKVGGFPSADLVGLSKLSGGSQRLPQYSLRSVLVATKSSPKSWFPYVVSQKGEAIAWSIDGAIVVKDAMSGGVVKLDAGSKSEVVSLSFSSDKTLSVIREDGALENWNLATKSKGIAGTQLSRNWTFWNQGPLLAVASLGAGSIGLLDVKNANENHLLLNAIPFRNGSVITLSREGVPAVGTKDGKIITFGYDPDQGFVAKRMFPLPETRSVRSLVFFGNKFLLAGGDFRSVFLVGMDGKAGGGALGVVEARNGARILALKQNYLAISTPDEILINELGKHLSVTQKGTLSFAFFSFAMALLSIGFNIIRDKK